MGDYIENPKTKGSGILCCIPQNGRCPHNCPDCFFQSGRSYLHPIEDNTPNMPSYTESLGKIIRVNDGNDSNVHRSKVINDTLRYARKFYNTSFPDDLAGYNAPVVLTINPAKMTDVDFHKLDSPPANLMFVRFRTNTWNVELLDEAVSHYTDRDVMVVLTFMAYFDEPIPSDHKDSYVWRKRTLNPYWVIKRKARERIIDRYTSNKFVDACGSRSHDTKCRWCGTCLKNYFATMEKLR